MWNTIKERIIIIVCFSILLIGIPSTAKATVIKGFTITSSNTQVYSDTNFSSPYGWIYGSDEVTVLEMNSNYCKVTYPISRGTKTGYIKTDKLFTRTRGKYYTASAKVSAYKRPGGNLYGYVASGDKVFVLGKSGSYTQVIYPVSWGYKVAFVTTDSCNTYIKRIQTETTWSYPMENAYVCGNNWRTYYSQRASRPYHVGLDLASRSGNANVYAAANGKVVARGWNGANGNYVIIQHSLGGNVVYSFYAHLSSISAVKNNNINRGSCIGVYGNTGSGSKGRHLHFAIVNKLWSNGSYYGYLPYFTGDKTTYSGVTYYNPHFVIQNNRLP